MIYVICGLIGAGKTTFARTNFGIVTDYDDIGSKEIQLAISRRLLKDGKTFAHITCYPTPKERAFFKAHSDQVKYVWIDTDLETAKDRIWSRHRERDMENWRQVLKRNKEYVEQLRRTSIDFIKLKSEDKLPELNVPGSGDI